MDKDLELIIVDAVTVVDAARAPGLHAISQAANYAASGNLLNDFLARKSDQTRRRMKADISLFERYLSEAGEAITDLARNLENWQGVSWGLISGFLAWQLAQGYAIGSINVRLATVRAYCKLSAQAGYIDSGEHALIMLVRGYRQAEGSHIDARRDASRREHSKKAMPVSISPAHAAVLKACNGSRRAGRDALLMALLLDHGLRVGEIANLNVASFDLDGGTFRFYRSKVHLWQTHNLTEDSLIAAQAYLATCASEQEPLYIGTCSKARVNARSLSERVTAMGKLAGLEGLSPHDCRHYWATQAIRQGTDIKALQDAGGWSSPAMPLRYAESGKIANAGVKLS